MHKDFYSLRAGEDFSHADYDGFHSIKTANLMGSDCARAAKIFAVLERSHYLKAPARDFEKALFGLIGAFKSPEKLTPLGVFSDLARDYGERQTIAALKQDYTTLGGHDDAGWLCHFDFEVVSAEKIALAKRDYEWRRP